MHYTTVLLAASATIANASAIAARDGVDINVGNSNGISCPDGWTANSQIANLDQSFCCPGATNVSDDDTVSCCVQKPDENVFDDANSECLATVPVTASDYSQQVYAALGTSAPASGAATSAAATQTAETATVTIDPLTVGGFTAGGVTIPAMTIPGQTLTGVGSNNGITIDSGAGRTSAAPTGNAGPTSSSTDAAAPAVTGMGVMAAGAVVAAGMILA